MFHDISSVQSVRQGRTKKHRDDGTDDDGTVYAGQPAVHLVRRALAAAVYWI